MVADSRRKKWIDVVKGIAIILVIAGHIITRVGSCEVEYIVQRIIYSFHMPLFFIVSGVTFSRNKSFGEFVSRKIKRLMFPAVIFSLIMLIMKAFLSYYSSEIHFVGLKSYLLLLVNNTINTVMMNPNSSFSEYWFFPVLFMAQIMFWWLSKIDKKCICAILCIIMIIINRLLFAEGIMLPFGLREAMLATVYIFLGYYGIHIIEIKKIESIKYWAIYFIVLLVFIAANIYNRTLINYYNSNIENIGVAILLGCTGSIFLILTVMGSDMKNSKLLQFLGKNSIMLYGLHYYFLEVWSNLYWNTRLCYYQDYLTKMIIDIIGIVFIIILCVMIILLRERYGNKK